MMREFLSFILIFFAAELYAQTVTKSYLRIDRVDNTQSFLPLDSIQTITFATDSLDPDYGCITVYMSSDGVMNELTLYVFTLDSVVFRTDTESKRRMWIYDHADFPTWDLPVANIDSIRLKLVKNENVIRYSGKYTVVYGGVDSVEEVGDFRFPVWGNRAVYCTAPLRRFELDSNLRPVRDIND